MLGFIDGYDFKEMPAQKYWAPPASWSVEKKREQTTSRIFSGEWYAAEKKDGYFAKFVKDEDGNILLCSRSRNVNGEFPEKHKWVPHLNDFFEAIPNGTCLLGELYLPSKPGSKNITSLLGCLKDKCIARQEKGEKLHFYVFDVLAFNGESYMNKAAIDRFDMVISLEKEFESEFVEFAQYYSGKQLWDMLQYILNTGGEGMVLVRGGSLYQPDKRPSKDCQKVKKELRETIDCFFTGRATPPNRDYTGKEIESWKYWMNIITGEKINDNIYKSYSEGGPVIPVTKSWFLDLAGSLEIGVVKGDKVVPIGYLSGLTEEIKSDPAAYKGRCIEVTAMEVDLERETLRHAKMLQFRDDLKIRDCTYKKIFGNRKDEGK